ncbi:ParB/RepB/Spo0J family partition protein [Aliivibrio fischeri]|uniref:ParB/RepB/Spo0J family partition protein n=1 Tax=Aliivibrio fischeri TaxID=668 RepID=UPI0012D95370|nr:ParB/RepB/Spo0J family partition protein [Aliivibrio fischeri]MUK92558.1 ParB/RepB/Spo0J family partition protein [Aliivibrio fischeri]
MTNMFAQSINAANTAVENKGNVKMSESKKANDELLMLPVDKIHFDPEQPRKTWDENALQELTTSIKATNGCKTPIKVKPHPSIIGEYMLMFGEGRLRSHQALNMTHILAMLKIDDIDEFELRFEQAAENISRNAMTVFDTATSLKNLMVIHKPKELNQTEIAKMFGLSKTYVSRVMKLLKAPECVQELSIQGITQNLNVLAYLTQLNDIMTQSELAQVIEEIKQGELSEKELQKIISEAKNPQPKKEVQNDIDFSDTGSGKKGLDNVSDSDDSYSDEGEETEKGDKAKDYGFYDYKDTYQKAVFDMLSSQDLAFGVTEEQMKEAAEKLEKTLKEDEFQSDQFKQTDMIKSMIKNAAENKDIIKTLLNVRSLRQWMRTLVNELLAYAEKVADLQSGKTKFKTLESFEVIDGELLLYIDGVVEPLRLSKDDVKELKGSI